MAAWGTGSFENEAAAEWFYLVEEAVARDNRGGEQGFQAPQSLLQVGQAERLCRIHCSKR